MKGDGSVYETPDRQGRMRWIAQLAVPGRPRPVRRWLPVEIVEIRNGVERRRAPTKKDAEKKLRELRAEAARGELNPAAAPEPELPPLPTLAEWLATWLDAGGPGGRKAKGPGPGTLDLYRGLLTADIKDSTQGALRLDELRRRDVRALLDDLAARGFSRSALSKVQGMISRSFKHALLIHEERLGDRANPAEDVGLPRTKEPTKRRALIDENGNVPEIVILLTAVTDHRLLAAWVRLGIDAAARPSELSALTWPDLDLAADEPTVTLNKTIVWERDEDGRLVPRVTNTKTGEPGCRKVTISAATATEMRQHKKKVATERLAARGYWPTEQDGVDLTNRVFRTEGGKLVDHHLVRRQLIRFSENAGIGKVNPYDLRHTGATLIYDHKGYEIAGKALGHVPAGGSRATAGYIHRRLVTIDSTVLDTVLAKEAERARKAANQ